MPTKSFPDSLYETSNIIYNFKKLKRYNRRGIENDNNVKILVWKKNVQKIDVATISNLYYQKFNGLSVYNIGPGI